LPLRRRRRRRESSARCGSRPRPGSQTLDRRVDDDEDTRRKAAGAASKPISRAKGATQRREGRLTIQAVAGDDEGAVERMRSRLGPPGP
jgi:translation initiation factor IF-2